MKIASLLHDGARRTGIVMGTQIAPVPFTLAEMVEAGLSAAADWLAAARDASKRIPLAEARLLPPVPHPERNVFCAGWNYWDHFEEGRPLRGGIEAPRPEHPTFFTKAPGTLIGPHDPIAVDPSLSDTWDYEAELALVLTPGGRSISRAAAPAHVFGYLLANDVSVRDVQRRHGGQWFKGKSLDGTLPLGPFIVTADAFDPADVQLECLVNGETVQRASTALMAFPVPELIEALSLGLTLRPGDILLTGTPAGVGQSRTPPLFLHPGDRVVVRAAGLGALDNTVIATDLAAPLG
ncbi:fumarylacetoacetate hydrolase family protein [Xanthobacter dioxanivorans]|uniref:Fumarylacetoacetate hydrolase family protein n=1 Tax=Xanthobacter dioxanivorans TaxID=2528964 RepID=A0A974PME6_9HYPH|nr:fumarylacetoacetate hydrolase family protein [Xanthobacter dioxanivorans]QRG05869.1 fumarylacetoacetate hydrolase family protein [Xanthobacter dioxanivorans]